MSSVTKTVWLGALTFAIVGCGDNGATSTTGNGGSSSGGSGGHPSSGTEATTSTGTASTGSETTTGSTTTSTSSTGSGVAPAECSQDTDCKLINDCCNCLSIPSSETSPACDKPNCLQATCTADSYQGSVTCQVGHCSAGFDCKQEDAACDSLPPNCADGKLPTVSSGCWGGCVSPEQCQSVSKCSNCLSTQTCVTVGGGVMKNYCVDTAVECGGTPSCACMGKAVCGSVACNDSKPGELDCLTP